MVLSRRGARRRPCGSGVCILTAGRPWPRARNRQEARAQRWGPLPAGTRGALCPLRPLPRSPEAHRPPKGERKHSSLKENKTRKGRNVSDVPGRAACGPIPVRPHQLPPPPALPPPGTDRKDAELNTLCSLLDGRPQNAPRPTPETAGRAPSSRSMGSVRTWTRRETSGSTRSRAEQWLLGRALCRELASQNPEGGPGGPPSAGRGSPRGGAGGRPPPPPACEAGSAAREPVRTQDASCPVNDSAGSPQSGRDQLGVRAWGGAEARLPASWPGSAVPPWPRSQPPGSGVILTPQPGSRRSPCHCTA